MKPTRKMQRLLERMAAIERMERGKICPMAGRPHYNHQTWQMVETSYAMYPKTSARRYNKPSTATTCSEHWPMNTSMKSFDVHVSNAPKIESTKRGTTRQKVKIHYSVVLKASALGVGYAL